MSTSGRSGGSEQGADEKQALLAKLALEVTSTRLGATETAEWWARLKADPESAAPVTLGELLTRLGPEDTRYVLGQVASSPLLPRSLSFHDASWAGETCNNLRANLGVWYSTLLIVGHQVYLAEVDHALHALERRMQAIAFESLRWLPGGVLAHVATYYSDSVSRHEEAHLVTCVAFTMDPVSSPG